MSVANGKVIVDTHVHIASTDLERYPVAQTSGSEGHWIHERKLPIERLIEQMDAAGVAKAVVVQPGPMMAENAYVTDSASRYPGRIVPVCVVDEFAPDAVERLEYWVRERGAAGVRLSVVSRADASAWLTDPALNPLWQAIVRLEIPACVHVRWSGLTDLRRMMEQHPDVTIALDHLAHAPVDGGPPFDAIQPLLDLAEFPNLYLKTTTHALGALANPAPLVELLAAKFGANRLTWGSNSPHDEGAYDDLTDLARAGVASLSDEDAAWFLGKTAMRLYPALAG